MLCFALWYDQVNFNNYNFIPLQRLPSSLSFGVLLFSNLLTVESMKLFHILKDFFFSIALACGPRINLILHLYNVEENTGHFNYFISKQRSVIWLLKERQNWPLSFVQIEIFWIMFFFSKFPKWTAIQMVDICMNVRKYHILHSSNPS